MFVRPIIPLLYEVEQNGDENGMECGSYSKCEEVIHTKRLT